MADGQVHARRVAGLIQIDMDGEQLSVRGSVEYRLSGVQNEAIDNANGTMAVGGKWVSGYIKMSISNYMDTDHETLKNAEGVTITFRGANGKAVVGKDCVQVDESVGNAETGEFPLQFASENVEEVK